MPPVSEAQFAFLLQLYQIEVVLHCPWKADQGGFEPLTSKHRHQIALWYIPWTSPKAPKSAKSKIQNPQDPKSQIPQIQNPKSPNPQNPKSPESKIQNPKSPNFGFWGFWILDFGSLCSKSLCEAPNAPNFGFWRKILDFGDFGDFGLWILGILDFGDFGFWGFWILDLGDFGFGILGPKSKIQNPPIQNPNFFGRFWGFWILDRYVANLYVAPNFGDFGFWGFWILDLGDFGFGDFGFWILDLGDFGFWGFWILDFGDFGFWFLDRYVANLYVRPPTPQIWGILDFGDFRDFGDFGFLGFWILEFGDFGILDFVTNFGFYRRRRRLCTPTRVGGL